MPHREINNIKEEKKPQNKKENLLWASGTLTWRTRMLPAIGISGRHWCYKNSRRNEKPYEILHGWSWDRHGKNYKCFAKVAHKTKALHWIVGLHVGGKGMCSCMSCSLSIFRVEKGFDVEICKRTAVSPFRHHIFCDGKMISLKPFTSSSITLFSKLCATIVFHIMYYFHLV